MNALVENRFALLQAPCDYQAQAAGNRRCNVTVDRFDGEKIFFVLVNDS